MLYVIHVIHSCTTILLSTNLWKLVGVKGIVGITCSDSFSIAFDSDNLVNDKRVFLGVSTINQLGFATLLGILC